VPRSAGTPVPRPAPPSQQTAQPRTAPGSGARGRTPRYHRRHRPGRECCGRYVPGFRRRSHLKRWWQAWS